MYSSPDDLPISLRWIAIMAGRVECDLAASTGVHNGEAFIKQILAGADAVQVASAFYKHGKEHALQLLADLEAYMDKHNFETISDFKAKMSYARTDNPAAFERAQFMKHFAGK